MTLAGQLAHRVPGTERCAARVDRMSGGALSVPRRNRTGAPASPPAGENAFASRASRARVWAHATRARHAAVPRIAPISSGPSSSTSAKNVSSAASGSSRAIAASTASRAAAGNTGPAGVPNAGS